MVDDIFVRRHEGTRRVLDTLVRSLHGSLGPDRDVLIGDHTCIYATGSCGRGEMGRGSDLDVHIARLDGAPLDDSLRIERAVTTANAAASLPPLDGGGRYLKTVTVDELLDLLGDKQDDAQDVLTKRMLLLLESRVLMGEAAHTTLVANVIDAYWHNEDLHPHDYLPVVLVNDIVRYWRIVLLNHESRLRKRRRELADDPRVASEDRDAVLLAERRYRSYKLRLPRCLTCFSALTYLLALTPTEPANVTRAQVTEMIGLTPVERLRRLPELVGRELALVDELLSVYRSYLERTDTDKQVLIDRLRSDPEAQRVVSKEGSQFTRLMFELVQQLGGGRPLHRHMLV